MGEQFTDTFDHYNTAFLQAQNMWEYVEGSPVISSSYARFPAIAGFPNQGVFLPAGGPNLIRKNLKGNCGTLTIFISFGGSLPSSSFGTFLGLLDNGSYQTSLALTSTGAFEFFQGSGSGSPAPLCSTAIGLITAQSKPSHGLEIEITFSPSGGSIQMWLDGAVVIPLTTGLNTITTSNSYANQIALGYIAGNGSNVYIDYVRVWDNTGSYQNAPVGYDVRKLTKLPTGAGFYSQWTANGATNNWQCVDDASPDGDTTYVSSSGLNYDSYAMGTSGLTGVPSQVVCKAYARKDDGATRALEIGVRSGTSNGLGTAATMGSTYAWVESCISLDPATGSPPTAAAADAFQFLCYEST